jgi:LysM repeat protein/beta-glucosidase-like glycosyl hydrolase
VSHGYQPQTSIVTKSLFWTFFGGVLIGTTLGYSIRPWFAGEESRPTEVQSTALTQPPEGTPEDSSENDTLAAKPPVSEEPAPPREAAPFDSRVDGLWPARHLFVGISGTQVSVETLEWLNEFKPGGVVLRPENIVDPLQVSALVLQLKQAVGLGTKISDPPIIFYQDESRPYPGVAATLEMASEGGASEPSRVALEQAKAARAHGIGAFLSPSLDIYMAGISAPPLERVALGSQPEDVVRDGLNAISGYRAGGVLSVASHFPGAGLSIRRSDGVWQIPADQMDAMSVAMEPFKAAIDEGVAGLLVGHMAVPVIDPDNPDQPAIHSKKLLRIFLRDTLRFSGIAIADDLERSPVLNDQTLGRLAATALGSGCDALLLLDADRSKLHEICSDLVRYASHEDFPLAQLKSSRSRLNTWQELLAAPPQPIEVDESEVSETLVATNTNPVAEEPILPVADPEESSKGEPAPEVEEVSPTEGDPATETEGATPPVVDSEKGEGSAPVVEAPSEPNPAPVGEDAEVDTAENESPPEMVEVEVELPATEEAIAGPDTAEVPKPEESEEDVDEPTNTTAEQGASALDTESEPKVGDDVTPEEEESEKALTEPLDYIEHTIERGDTLIELAIRYGVSVDDLIAWNELESQKIKFGFKLKVGRTEEATPETEEASLETQPEDADGEDGPAEESDDTEEALESEPDVISETMAIIESEEQADLESISAPSDTGEMEANTSDAPAPPEEPVDVSPPVETPPSEEVAEEPALSGSTPEEDPEEKSDDETSSPPAAPVRTPQPPDTDKRTHTVVAGDNIPAIAERYGVEREELVAWNALEGTSAKLEPGMALSIYLPMAAAVETNSDPDSYQIHVVGPGDNLRRIAAEYGVTQQALIDLNNILRPDHVQLGWKLKIPNK